MTRPFSTPRLWRLMVVLALLTGIVRMPTAGGLSSEARGRATRSTVQIIILSAEGKSIGSCSGAFVDPSGLILTNYHCVGLRPDATRDESNQGLSPGDLYHPQGYVAIAPAREENRAPVPAYLAQFRSGSPALDLAVLKVIGAVPAGTPLPELLPVAVLLLADAGTVRAGEAAYIAGYPGTGGTTAVALTSGQFTGEADTDGDGVPEALTYSARGLRGLGGGPVLNDRGEQVAVHTYTDQEERGSGIMANFAVPYIREAQRAPRAGPPPAAQPPARPSPPAGSRFGPISFATGVEGGRLVNEGTSFASGVPTVVAAFAYSDVRPGSRWSYIWLYEGRRGAGQENLTWSEGEQGTLVRSLNSEGGLPEGAYELALSLDGREVQRGGFRIGTAGSTAPRSPQPPAPAAAAIVALWGRLVDADTRKGIPGAVFTLLKPGVSVAQWQKEGRGVELVRAVTDQYGWYSAPGVPIGQTYTVIAQAKGYETVTGSDDIRGDGSTVLQLDDIRLVKR